MAVEQILELEEITENILQAYFSHGELDGIASMLEEEAVAYSPQASNYIRGNWEVRQFLRKEYEDFVPCKIARMKLRHMTTEEGITVLANLMLSKSEYYKSIFLRIALMFRLSENKAPSITGIHMYRDYRHESTYRAVNTKKENDKAATYMAMYDDLTGVFNKRTFYIKAKEMILENTNRKFDILRINVDRFKALNDLLGEAAGDRLLRYIGRFLKDLNLKFCVCGRLYADNFAVCLESGNGNSMRLIRTLQLMADSFDINYRTSLSFGLYSIEDVELSIGMMCDRANIALSQAKGNFQKPYCKYNENMRQQMVMEQKIVNAMELAIENKEFTLYLQPKYEIDTNSIIGAEALVRWNSKTGGFISPGDFIPVFEKNGFVYDVDKFIWEESCRYLRKWMDKGLDPKPISVNVSRIDLYDSQVVEYLVGLREKYNIPSYMLELEITESAYTENPEQIIYMTQRLREAGFSILMDDFGSGYSSLNMLKDIHIDVLKLDMGFLRSNHQSVRGENILAAIVQMANSLGINTIAEGVETKEQVELLRFLGCKWVQGYYYSKPIPAYEMENMLCK